MELQDLDNLAASSLSVVSISSDSYSYFDSVAFFQDLNDQILVQSGGGKRLNGSDSVSNESVEVLMVPPTLGGGFTELQDLDAPIYASLDECVDSVALLQELDNQISEQVDAGRKHNACVSNKSEEMLMVSPTFEELPLISVAVSKSLVEMNFSSRGQINFISGGDFIELQDLDNLISPSDELFNSMALLQDLDNQNFEQNDAIFVSNKSEEMVMVSPTFAMPISLCIVFTLSMFSGF